MWIIAMRILYFQSQTPLQAFSEACLSLTPRIFVHKDHEIFLDIGVTKKLFNGEKNILARAEKLMLSFKIAPKMVVTDRFEWARVFLEKDHNHIPEGKSHSRLMGLPIDRLLECGDPAMLEKEMPERIKLIAFMKRVGLRVVSDFAQLNATAINRRFGKLGVHLQQWVMGTRELCLPPFTPEQTLKETLDTEEIGSLEQLLLELKPLFQRMEARLLGRAKLAREITFVFHLDSGEKSTKYLKLSEPMRETFSFLKLIKDFLGKTTWESPLKEVEIEITDMIPFLPGQLSLFDTTENRFSELSPYVERLKNRYGDDAVGFADLKESYLPERSWKMVFPPPANSKAPRPKSLLRPPLLFSPPKPYFPSRNSRLIPSENLDCEWWEEGGHRRYFVTQNPQGERLWIFWDCDRQEWFLHGTFD